MKYDNQLKSVMNSSGAQMNWKVFKNIEFVIYCIHRHTGEFEMATANYYFTQFFKRYQDCIELKRYEKTLMVLRKKYHHYYSKKRLELDFKEYFKLPEELRLFKLINNSLIEKKDISILVDRESEYENMLREYSNNNEEEIEFIEGQGCYKRVVRTANQYDKRFKSNFYRFDLEDEANLNDHTRLPVYKEKEIMSLPLDYDWDKFKLGLGEKWAQRPSIDICDCDDFSNAIRYEGPIHIAGLLGAGKSTYIVQETVRLRSQNEKIKIGIVEPNVSEVIKTLENLKELGINAVPIIGNTQLDKHFKRYSNSNFGQMGSFNGLLSEDMRVLDYFTGNCLLAHHTDDHEIDESKYPCTKLNKDENSKRKYACPLYDKCGFYKRYLELANADVWITTPHSLISSKTNGIIDPLKRTYYELFHDCLDIIFVDEVDSVQEEFDNQFITDEVFYGEKNSIVKRLERVKQILQIQKNTKMESETHRWISNFDHLSQLMNRVEYMMLNLYGYRRYLTNEMFTPRNLFESIISDIDKDRTKETDSFISILETFLPLSEELQLNNELIEHEIFMLYDRFSKSPNMGDAGKVINRLIDEYVNKFSITIKKSEKYDREGLFKKKFELFVYLVLIDYYFRVQNNIIENIAHKIPEIYTVYSRFQFFNRDFIHIVTESIIGNIFGYKFCIDQDRDFSIRLINYSGIGRSLLEEWHMMKNEKGKKGPSVVMLSGTSYAPESAHYHIEEEPQFVLNSEKPEGRIEQIINVKHDKRGKAIRVSGVSKKNLKRENLIQLVNLLENDFRYELEHWSKADARKVIIVVNSYEQCRVVGDYFSKKNMTYKVLSGNSELRDDEINTSAIEDIPKENPVDILVAPLSIISRGYNIVKENGDSYFGSIFFLIRPYITPGDMGYNYRILNSVVMPEMMKWRRKGTSFKEAMEKTRKFAFDIASGLKDKKFWKNLDKDQRAILAWFTFIPIKQAIGRLQRNGCSCRVFYCDASFVIDDKCKLTSEKSMLKAWQENLQKIDTKIGKLLYGKFLEGLKESVNKYEDLINEEEIY